jgi:hypothetical protein
MESIRRFASNPFSVNFIAIRRLSPRDWSNSPPTGSYLVDTNLLLRLADSGSKQHSVAVHALVRLLGPRYHTAESYRVLGRSHAASGCKRFRMEQRADSSRSLRLAGPLSATSGFARSFCALARAREATARLWQAGSRVSLPFCKRTESNT